MNTESDKLLIKLISDWNEADCIAYLKARKLEQLQDICEEVLLGEFADCNTIAQLQTVGCQFDWLAKPSIIGVK